MIRLTEEERTAFTAVNTIPQVPDCTERGELAEHEHRFASADAMWSSMASLQNGLCP